jgi:hypothetical protein
MTLVQGPKAEPTVDDALLLFQEAKERRRRRWVRTGIVAWLTIVLIGVAIGLVSVRGGSTASKPPAIPGSAAGADHVTAHLSFRPALCYAPPLKLSTGQTPSPGPQVRRERGRQSAGGSDQVGGVGKSMTSPATFKVKRSAKPSGWSARLSGQASRGVIAHHGSQSRTGPVSSTTRRGPTSGMGGRRSTCSLRGLRLHRLRHIGSLGSSV